MGPATAERDAAASVYEVAPNDSGSILVDLMDAWSDTKRSVGRTATGRFVKLARWASIAREQSDLGL